MSTLRAAWEFFLTFSTGIGAWVICSSVYIYLRDRTGNSGRYRHWTEE